MKQDGTFLGKGWGFPPTFAQGGADIEMVAGADDIHQSLRIIVSTQPGERVMQDQFGCDMHSFAFEEFDQSMRNTMRQTLSDAILYHEPRIKLEGLEIVEDEPGRLRILIDYTVRSTNSRYNMVFPFYYNEANVRVA